MYPQFLARLGRACISGRLQAPQLSSKLVIRAPQEPPDAGFLTKFTASHGGAEDSLILSVVECVAIPIHWMVEKREVPMVEEYRSERAVPGTPTMHLS